MGSFKLKVNSSLDFSLRVSTDVYFSSHVASFEPDLKNYLTLGTFLTTKSLGYGSKLLLKGLLSTESLCFTPSHLLKESKTVLMGSFF